MKNNKKKCKGGKSCFSKLESVLEASKLSYLRIYFPLEDLISTIYTIFLYKKKGQGIDRTIFEIFVTHIDILDETTFFNTKNETHGLLEFLQNSTYMKKN